MVGQAREEIGALGVERIGYRETLLGWRLWRAPKNICPPRRTVDDFQNRNWVINDDFFPSGCVSEDVEGNLFK